MSPGNKAVDMMPDAYTSAHGHAYRTPAIVCLVCERPKLHARDLWRGENAEFLKVCGDCWAKPCSLHLFDAVAAGRLTPQQAVEVMTWKPEPCWKRWWRGWSEDSDDSLMNRLPGTRRVNPVTGNRMVRK